MQHHIHSKYHLLANAIVDAGVIIANAIVARTIYPSPRQQPPPPPPEGEKQPREAAREAERRKGEEGGRKKKMRKGERNREGKGRERE